MMEMKYDPWGPLSGFLREHKDADLLATVVDYTGVQIRWPSNASTHKERIREAMPVIHAAYNQLPNDQKGLFCQIVAKNILRNQSLYPNDKKQLRESLNDIGWNITDDGILQTQDALISERFSPLEHSSMLTRRSNRYLEEPQIRCRLSMDILAAYCSKLLPQSLTFPSSV